MSYRNLNTQHIGRIHVESIQPIGLADQLKGEYFLPALFSFNDRLAINKYRRTDLEDIAASEETNDDLTFSPTETEANMLLPALSLDNRCTPSWQGKCHRHNQTKIVNKFTICPSKRSLLKQTPATHHDRIEDNMLLKSHLKALQIAVQVLPQHHPEVYLSEQKLVDYRQGFLTSNVSNVVRVEDLLDKPGTPSRVRFGQHEMIYFWEHPSDTQKKLLHWQDIKSNLYSSKAEAHSMLSMCLSASPSELYNCSNVYISGESARPKQ